MSYKIPFTAYLKVTPDRANGKRFEYVRGLQKAGYDVYAALDTDAVKSSGIYIANPGGGQFSNSNRFSNIGPGAAVTPQFGEKPSILTITGFYAISTDTIPYAERQVVNCNEWKTGINGGSDWAVNPVSSISSEVSALKTAILDAITLYGLSYTVEMFRLEYKGIKFGDRGYHFP